MSEAEPPVRRGPGRPRRQATRTPQPEAETETDDDDDYGDFQDVTELILEDVERPKKLKLVSKHLSDNYFSMSKELNKEMGCSICLSNIDCKCCFSLLSCGHSFHASCLLLLSDQICPVCRDHTH